MEHKCKNCKAFRPDHWSNGTSGSCQVLTDKAHIEKAIPDDVVFDLKDPKQGDVMAQSSGIGVGSEYGTDCQYFEIK